MAREFVLVRVLGPPFVKKAKSRMGRERGTWYTRVLLSAGLTFNLPSLISGVDPDLVLVIAAAYGDLFGALLRALRFGPGTTISSTRQTTHVQLTYLPAFRPTFAPLLLPFLAPFPLST